ncbi:hypothetical protein O6H91_10G028800 [Diphasiastrum complanatum]|uniref:Uncharacterized protein n=1 Tax=Diphasiastrum complanatum TaxID=34168 RepID=A0ACC2CFT0_DIPCM|nr:hypothetical protein O6H91_Y355700 [Diphasiastrum complanatum]KAJ7540744.1 hypothetical protein O6H91_10G028800 [Diphasiastrum complanatum]
MVAVRIEDGVVNPNGLVGTDADLDPNSYSLEKFTLYETRARFFLVGRDRSKTHWRVLKIDRSEPALLSISEDPVIYTQNECKKLLHTVAEGNRATGGLNLVTKAYGIVGFIKFMESYYMILITKRRQIGTLCGHPIYGIEQNQLITVPHSSAQSDVAHSRAELRYKKLLSSVDVTKDFFFSHTYPLMQSLQKNALGGEGNNIPYENMFVWNAYLTRGIRECLKNTRWTIALIHGYFEQARLSIFGRVFALTLIARRSRHFAGTRYLKRGVNDKGRVANDVETEQIVLDEDYHIRPGRMCSVVQNRGSIPLFWSQEASRLSPKPDIILQRYDPIYQATKLHFEDLSKRYGNPIIILNLIRTAEQRPREMILRREFANAVGYLNQVLPDDKRLKFIHWDFHKFSKSKSANVLAVLGAVASEALDLTGIYYSGKPLNAKQKLQQQRQSSSSTDGHFGRVSPPLLAVVLGRRSPGFDHGSSTSSTSSSRESLSEKEQRRDKGQEIDHSKEPTCQSGVLRTNCIDCLDRTNIAQYAYGLASLGRQLHVMELTEMPKLDPDSTIATALMHMYEKMGDALALQYGGSAAHNTVFLERQGKWKAATQSQEFLKSIKRYYSNTYTDGEKQDAINLFLGHFQPQQGKPALWELDSDYYLHVGGYRDESPVSGKTLSQQKSFSCAGLPMERNNGPLSRIPSYQDDFQRMKLTSFDKLIQVTCGTLRNVRTHTDSDMKNGMVGRMTCTAPDATEIQLKSPNWLFGHSKHERSQASLSDILQSAPDDKDEVKMFDDSEFDWVSSLGIPSEEDMYDRYLMTATSEHNSWYGSELFPGTDEGSEANQHYTKCCQGQVLDPFDLTSEKNFDQYNASIEDAISFQDDIVASSMEAALAEYEEIGLDLGCTTRGRATFNYTESLSNWIFNTKVV